MDATTDATDWATAVRGNGESFGLIFDRHRDRVLRHSLRLVPTWHDAEEVVAVTFLEAWRKRDSVRFVDGSLLPWLLLTASYSARNVSRSSRRYRDLLAKVPPVETVAGPDELVDDGEAVQALRHLTAQHRDVVTLCVLEGLTEAEAADVLRLPVGTVKSRLHRAKKALAKLLDKPALTAELEMSTQL